MFSLFFLLQLQASGDWEAVSSEVDEAARDVQQVIMENVFFWKVYFTQWKPFSAWNFTFRDGNPTHVPWTTIRAPFLRFDSRTSQNEIFYCCPRSCWWEKNVFHFVRGEGKIIQNFYLKKCAQIKVATSIVLQILLMRSMLESQLEDR